MITIVNVRKKQPADFPPTFVYVGRRVGSWRGSPLGNSYKPAADTDAITLFRQWLWDQMQDPTSPATVELHRLAALARAGDLQLGCWCAPEPCHAEVIKSAIEWLLTAHSQQ